MNGRFKFFRVLPHPSGLRNFFRTIQRPVFRKTQVWNNPLFLRHLDGWTHAGDWPVAIVPPRVLAAIGGKSRTVRLSPYTAGKQKHRHKDLAPEDYARVQRILDEGELFMQGNDRVKGFIEEDGRLWSTVAKATKDKDGEKTFLATLHKANEHNLGATRRELKRIDREGE